ncbi:MAG: CHAT domain-containing protein, partial [Acidobacteria bacterium]|nr:CHAT domain-containing protein [Acidobacteriota bacterium]
HPELQIRRGAVRRFNIRETTTLVGDASTAVLEYVVTDTRAYVFVLTRTDAQSAVRMAAVRLDSRREDLAPLVDRFHHQLAARDLAFADTARRLYDLLIAPVSHHLIGRSALIIVPDGPLWNIPFRALRTPSNQYLVESHAISVAPSLTVLRSLGEKRSSGRRAREATTLLAFGNPSPDRGASPSAGAALPPLMEAERQVRAIARLYGSAAKIYVRAEARETLAKAEAARFDVLQFAAHGILDDASPMYSRLVLAAPPRGGAVDDGLLEAWEMMRLDLDADLVVLSACETARGRVAAGEGVIGMTWALFVAGATSVVVSHWKVDASSTTDLMVELHRQIRRAKSSKAEALRRASLLLLQSERYRHPYYWAPFVLVGDAY